MEVIQSEYINLDKKMEFLMNLVKIMKQPILILPIVQQYNNVKIVPNQFRIKLIKSFNNIVQPLNTDIIMLKNMVVFMELIK